MFVPKENQLGIQPIALSSATQSHPLGTIIRAYDPVYGEGEFIYLLGVANTVVGSLVTWAGVSSGTPTYQTTLAPSTANLDQPVAVAMSANVAGQYGWYQIAGTAVVATNGTLAGAGAVYAAGTGQVTSTQANGKQIVNASALTATGTPAAGQALLEMQRPFVQGQAV
jgi:hypothetical protein